MKEINILRDNVALLYKNFDKFQNKAKYFMAPLPFEVKYELSFSKKQEPFETLYMVKSPITLGALLICWRDYPELFTIKKNGSIMYIYAFNGSPLSGANWWSGVNLETGEFSDGKNGNNFRKRCQCLNDAVLQSEEMLKQWQESKGIKGFVPASLNEVIDYVDSLISSDRVIVRNGD